MLVQIKEIALDRCVHESGARPEAIRKIAILDVVPLVLYRNR
jgi:hypothetical protein